MRHRVYMILARLGVLALALFMPFSARAQGSRHDDIVLNRFGQPVAGASVTVCTSGATGTPCSPLANVYSNLALTQALANPFTSDGQGNYYFYAAPGRYIIQISGAGVSTTTIPDVLLPADPTSPSYQSLSVAQNISAVNLSLSGALSVSGGISSPSTLSAPQQGSSAPNQLGVQWSPGIATGVCQVPAAPTVQTETISSGTGNFVGGATYYVEITLYNRNGQTAPSAATAYTPSSGSTNRALVQISDASYRSGCYGYRVYISASGPGGPFYEAQAWTLPQSSISSWSRSAGGVVTVTTTAAHGFGPGQYVTISGAANGTNGTSINGSFYLIGQQGSSPTKFFLFQYLGADSSSTAQGTATVIAGLGSDSYGHMAPGDFIVAAVPTSGNQPPTSNTAAIDPIQVALNYTCIYPNNSCTSGELVVPQGSQTLTTPLILSNQQAVVGVNKGGAGGKSELYCPWADLNLGCVMVLGTVNGLRVEGLDIESSGHGIIVGSEGGFSNGSNSIFTNNNIVSGSIAGMYAAVVYRGIAWYEQNWQGNFLQGDLADLLAYSVAGGVWNFEKGRWNAANLSGYGLSTNGFLGYSSVTDLDRAMNNGSFPMGVSNLTLSDRFIEQGTGVAVECPDFGCILKNMNLADSTAISGTPALFRFGLDANTNGTAATYIAPAIEDSHLTPASGVADAIQIIPSIYNPEKAFLISNSVIGGQIDLNNQQLTIQCLNSNCYPYEENTGTGAFVNVPSGANIDVTGTSYSGNSVGGWASYQMTGGMRFLRGGAYGSPDLYFEPYNYNNSIAGGWWFAGDPGANSGHNLFMSYGVNGQATFSLFDSAGNTMFNYSGASAFDGFAICGGTLTGSKVTFGCPVVDSSGATVKGALTGTSGSIGGSSLSAGACTSGTVSITGATTSMAVAVSPSADPGAGFAWEGFVSSSGTVTVRVCAIAAGTPTSTTYNVRVIQ